MKTYFKKIIAMTIFFTLMLTCYSGKYAKGDEIKQKERKIMSIEQIKQEKLTQKEMAKLKLYQSIRQNIAKFSTVDYSLNDAYAVKLLTPLMISEYKKSNKDFQKLLSGEEQWFLPLTNKENKSKGVARFVDKEGKLELLDINLEENLDNLLGKEDEIFAKLDEKTKFVTELEYVYSPFYHMSMVYFNAGSQSYIIPYTNLEKQIELKNGQVYDIDKFFELLDNVFDENITSKDVILNEDSLDTDKDSEKLPFRNRKFPLKSVAVGSCVAAVALASIVIILKRSRKKHR